MSTPDPATTPMIWPPNVWEVRRVTTEFVLAFHVSKPGFMVERLPKGDIILVQPPGPEGYRPTGLTSVFTELAAELPEPFDNACIRADDVVDKTELIELHEGELSYGSSGATVFPYEGSDWCADAFASDIGFLKAWLAGRVDTRVLADVLSIDSSWCADPKRLRRFLTIVEDLRLQEDLREALEKGTDFWQAAEPFLSDTKLGLEENGDELRPVSGSFHFERRS